MINYIREKIIIKIINMKIHYFNDLDTATTFTFEDERGEGDDDMQELNDFTAWLNSASTSFMKLKIKNNKSFNTYVVVAKSTNESYDIVTEPIIEETHIETHIETVDEDEGKKRKKKKEKKTVELTE